MTKIYVTHDQLNNTKLDLIDFSNKLSELYVEFNQKFNELYEKRPTSCDGIDNSFDINHEVSYSSEITHFRDQITKLGDMTMKITNFEYGMTSLKRCHTGITTCIENLESFDSKSVKLPEDRSELIKKNNMKVSNVTAFVRELKKKYKEQQEIGQYQISNEFTIKGMINDGGVFHINSCFSGELTNEFFENIINNAYIHKNLRIMISLRIRGNEEKSMDDFFEYGYSENREKGDFFNDPDNFTIWKSDDKEAWALHEFNKI
jgi:polyhydroxyalkanoate synthesis regulator phasin